jgi:hypothetical protein
MITRLLRVDDEQDWTPHADLRCDRADRGSGADVAAMMMSYNYNSAAFPKWNTTHRGIELSAMRHISDCENFVTWLNIPLARSPEEIHNVERFALSASSSGARLGLQNQEVISSYGAFGDRDALGQPHADHHFRQREVTQPLDPDRLRDHRPS